MPVTFTAPIAQPAQNGISNVTVTGSAEDQQITLNVLFADSNNNVIGRQQVLMTPAAFFTAMTNATGSWKNRLYTVALAQLSQTGTIT